MEFFEEIEYDCEAYTSLLLTQKTLGKLCEDKNVQITEVSEIQNILRKPRIFVFRNQQNTDILEDPSFLTVTYGIHKGRKVQSDKKRHLQAEFVSEPFAVVVILNPSGKRLRENDVHLLATVKDFLTEVKNVVYVVKENRHSAKYEVGDLDIFSRDVHRNIYGENGRNDIFSKLFLQNDTKIPIRIGLCLHNSILVQIKTIYNKLQDKITAMKNDLKRLNSQSETNTDILQHKLLKLVNSKCSSGEKEPDILRVASNCLSKLALETDLINSLKGQENNISSLLRRPFQNTLKDLRTESQDITVKDEKSLPSASKSASRLSPPIKIHKKSAARMSISNASSLRTISIELYNVFLSVIKEHVDNSVELMTSFCERLYEEFNKRDDGILLHEWKTVVERNNRVKGFGYLDGTVHVYLKSDSEKDKISVVDFVDKYIPASDRKFPIKIEYKQRKITLFAKLEQGSQVNQSTVAEDGYGTLGMFLEDNDGKYFFTTCAHVIGEGDVAYSPDDNSVLGKSVLVYDSNTNNEKDLRMDFSLIHISPDSELTCTVGLKNIEGKFIRGELFRGDISEIYLRPIYKWAANKPYLKTAVCIGFEDDQDNEGVYHCLQVDNKEFAKPGDSGAIICIGKEIDTGMAALVLVGGDLDENSDKLTLVTYKVSDALDKVKDIKSNVKPCLVPCTRPIPISASASGRTKNMLKRKSEKVLAPRSSKKFSHTKK